MLLSYLVVLVFLAGCGRQAKIVEQPFQLDLSPELQSIDSLLQQRPDSALMRLIEFQPADHYRSLLLSEALYKTDNTQQNRDDLLAAMCYFDSLAAQHPDNDDLTLLSARSHYMNGVGYYEADSIVDACREYLHTLEIMEGHFNEEDLVGYKAKFLGLTYTRLGETYYKNEVPKPAIKFYKNALTSFKKALHYSLANTYRRIGGSYYLDNNNDSAIYYYRKAIDLAKRQNNRFVYSASLSESAPIYYVIGYKDSAFRMIRESLSLSANEDQRLAKCFTLGLLYWNENLYDSAVYYFQQSIQRDFYNTRTASEEKLIDCYHKLGDSIQETFYKLQHNESLQLFVEHSTIKVDLLSLYDIYMFNRAELQHQSIINQHNHRTYLRLLFVFVIIVMIVVFSMYKHKIKDVVISELNIKVKAKSFKEEPICIEILSIVNTHRFKAQMDYRLYTDCALGIEQLDSLHDAVDAHYNSLTKILKDNYSVLNNDDINYCCLYLLGLKDADVSALMQRSYRAVCDRNRKLRTVFGIDYSICTYLKNMAVAKSQH